MLYPGILFPAVKHAIAKLTPENGDFKQTYFKTKKSVIAFK
jgi:hypothetical protein